MFYARASTRCTGHLYSPSIRTLRGSAQRRIWQRLQRRPYASSGPGAEHPTHKSSGDKLWAFTSLAIFLPSAYYLALPQINKKPHDDHGHGHEEHEEHDEESKEHGEGESENEHSEESKTDDPGEEGKYQENKGEETEGDEGKSEEGRDSDEGSSDAGSEGETTPDTSEGEESDDDVSAVKQDKGLVPTKEGNSPEGYIKEESSSEVEGVKFKGATNQGEDHRQSHTTKHVPDAKGYNKKRMESHYGIVLGSEEHPDQDPSNKDTGAAAKQPGSMNVQSGKQEGLSNTNTKHSTDITKNPDKSKKADGSAETSKHKGTVDPSRPLRGV